MNTRHATARFAAAAVATAFLATSCASGRKVLEYDLDAGERFTLTVSRQQVRDRTFGGNRMVDTTWVRSTSHFEVAATRPDGVELTIEYGNRSLESSRAPDASPDFEPLKGSRASFRLDRTGEVGDFEGFFLLPMVSVPGEMIGGPQYEMELRALLPHLPGKELEPGETWTHHAEIQDASSGMPLDIVLDFVYTLEGPAKDSPDLLAIDCAYTVSISGPVDAGDFFLDLDMAGEGAEEILFDPGRHMIASSTGTMWIEGKAANAEMGFEAPLRNEHVTEVRATF